MLWNTKLLLLIQCDGAKGIGEMLLKGTNLQLQDKFQRFNAQHGGYGQLYLKVAKRQDPKCSHHKKK